MLQSSVTRYSGLFGVAVVIAAVGAPAFAQVAVGETTVTATPVDRISTAVDYGDLDLTTRSGRAALHHRVQHAATSLCRRLGEDHLGSALGEPSCEQGAIMSAASQEHEAIATAKARTYAGAPAPTGFVMAMHEDGAR